jgi:hypothetical protein
MISGKHNRVFILFGLLTAVVSIAVLADDSNTTNPAPPASNHEMYVTTKPTDIARQKLACAQRAMQLIGPDAKGALEGSLSDATLWSRRLLDAELDLAPTRQEREAAMHKYCDHMKTLEDEADRRSKRGWISPLQRESITYQRLEIEQKLNADH